MEIKEIDYSPDSTYFRTGDVEPEIKDGVLEIYSGTGTRRSSWGAPGCNSFAILNDADLTSVLVGFFHKHGGSQFWRHYKNGQRVDWKKLDESDRIRIIDAHTAKSPKWAKIPGKLKRDYIIPSRYNKVEKDNAGNITAYKVLKLIGNIFYSPIYQDTRWDNQECHSPYAPNENNTSGIYCAKTPNSPILTNYKKAGYALVRLILSGTVVEGNYGYRAEHAQILDWEVL